MKYPSILSATAVALLVGTAPATAATISGSLSASDPTWNRHFSGCGNFSTAATGVPYDAYDVSVSASGAYTFEITSGFNTWLGVYTPTFSPTSPSTTCFQTIDVGGSGTNAALLGGGLSLIAGTNYVAVVSANGAQPRTGDYTLAIGRASSNTTNGVVTISPVAVPLPGTLALLGFGLAAGAGLARRRR